MSSVGKAQIILFVDPSSTWSTLPPGYDEPAFECDYAQARFFVGTAHAGSDACVLHQIAQVLSPPARAIALWMVRELRAAQAA